MANDVRVKLKMRGINALMKSQPVVSDVAKRTARMKRAAGDGFEQVVIPRRFYTVGYVRTATEAARKRQAEDAVLQKALDAGRG